MDSGAENKVQSVVHPVVDLIVAASKKDSEESRGSIKSDFTVTELLLPPRIYVLMQQHRSQIVESAESWFNMLMGSAIHEYIARLLQRYPQFRREERLTISVEVDGRKYLVSGKFDAYDKMAMVLYDFKSTSIWSIIHNDKPEWMMQGQMYAELVEQCIGPVMQFINLFFLKDWNVSEAQRKPDLPQLPYATRTFDVWPKERRLDLIRSRLKLIHDAVVNLPLCSNEDRWTKPTVYAVMKPGRISAVSLHDNLSDAQVKADGIKGGDVIKRPGESVRCARYCSVAPFCTQYQEELNGRSKGNAKTLEHDVTA